MESKKQPDFTKLVDIQAFIYEELFFCGCHEEGEVLDTLRKYLEWCGAGSERPNFDEFYKGKIGAFYLISGLLDRAGLVEHGVSVRVPFLSSEGEAFLKALQTHTPEQIMEAEGVAYSGLEYKRIG